MNMLKKFIIYWGDCYKSNEQSETIKVGSIINVFDGI